MLPWPSLQLLTRPYFVAVQWFCPLFTAFAYALTREQTSWMSALNVNPDERVFIVLSCSFYQWCDSIFLPIFNWYPCVLFLEVLVHRSFIIRRGVLVVVPVLYYASVYTAMTFDLYNFVYIAFNDIYMSLEVHEATKLPLKLCNHCLHVSTVIIHVVLKGQCCNKQ